VPGLSTRADPNRPSRAPCSACPLCAQCKLDFGIRQRRLRLSLYTAQCSTAQRAVRAACQVYRPEPILIDLAEPPAAHVHCALSANRTLRSTNGATNALCALRCVDSRAALVALRAALGPPDPCCERRIAGDENLHRFIHFSSGPMVSCVLA
jgi:hypothetical protein